MTFGRLVVALIASQGVAHGASSVSGEPSKYELAFREFVSKYGRVYESPNEEKMRFHIFEANMKLIETQNAQNHSYSLGVNEFADQAPAEFQSTRLGLMQPPAGGLWAGLPHLGTHRYSGAKLPSSVDWSAHGAVTPIKNQGTCGSCWAFSTTGALEGAWQVATGHLVSLSEQQLVDCSSHNHGCGGGSMDLAFKYLKDQPLCTEGSYAYKAHAGKCRASNCTVGLPKGSVIGYKDVPADDMNALMEAVSHQPVSVAIEADQTAFQLYNGGVLAQPCGDKLDHGVLLVGYGSENGMDYWKVKNSWGASWGEDGYIRLKRGVPMAGECGIKSMSSYPVVRSSDAKMDKYQVAFQEFVANYGRVFQSVEEEQHRFDMFKSNYKFIESENEKNNSYVLAVNEFADQAPAEFQAQRLGLRQPESGELWAGLPHLGTHKYSGSKLPASVDWSTQGAVTQVKNQKTCGSCWAFSTTGALEGAWQIATGKLVSLSEQQLVDCSTDNNGCGGGSMDSAFNYMKDSVACTERSYSYEAKAGSCRVAKCTTGIPSGSVAGYKDVPSDDMLALMEAVSHQPVSVAIEADQMVFQMYSGGVLSKSCGHKLDHGVLLVGYGSEEGIDYWKVKNSWGASWGEDGYVRMKRGVPKAGECGIKSMSSYPVVHGMAKDTIVV